MKLLKIIVMLSISCSAFAQQNNSSLNLSIPQASGSYLSDRFRAGELDCSMAIGSATSVEFGVTGIINKSPDGSVPISSSSVANNNIGVYGRIIIPIGAPTERINCNTLYELELQKKRIEVLKLQEEVNQLKKLKFEN
jgi:hypothetical protein